MRDNYTSVHGRTLFDNDHDKITGSDHFVPEGWENLDRGICPRCGRTVAWNERLDRWVTDPDLTVLVLRKDEFDKVLERSIPADADLAETLERQNWLNRPFDE